MVSSLSVTAHTVRELCSAYSALQRYGLNWTGEIALMLSLKDVHSRYINHTWLHHVYLVNRLHSTFYLKKSQILSPYNYYHCPDSVFIYYKVKLNLSQPRGSRFKFVFNM